MDAALDRRIQQLWAELEDGPAVENKSQLRIYQRLDLERETGLRLSIYSPGKLLELLVEIGTRKKKPAYFFPEWKGMTFDLVKLDVPVSGTWHICLRLESAEHREVFISVCTDLAEELQQINAAKERESALLNFMDRWSRFFEKYNSQGLSGERQRGLFGELWWLRTLLQAKIPPLAAVESWKGCQRTYHDFDLGGMVVEVKTTLTKEPRKVQIASEKQLDDCGLVSLHLLVLTLVQSEAGGETLPDMIRSIKGAFSGDPGSLRKFERSLYEAGYLETQARLYETSYTVRITELLRVVEGFPRIVAVPAGLGDLKYSLIIGACSKYLVNTDEYISLLKGGQNG
jgi:hypothetical protein